MKSLGFGRYAIWSCAAAAMLTGCGGSQPPIGAPGEMPQGSARSLTAIRGHRASSAYQVLYRFDQRDGGRDPVGQLIDVNGTLYGTTAVGGKSRNGTVYSISPSSVEKTLYQFRGGSEDGAHPAAGLGDVNGTLYGTTIYGGASYGSPECDISAGCGTVFAITRSGKEKVIHSFVGGTDGSLPYARLLDVKGTLYGTTLWGGAHGWGTVYSISTAGSEKVLYSFTNGNGDGSEPGTGLIDVKGTLYGTTGGGGLDPCACGVVYSITLAGVEKVLHAFGGSSGDGATPSSGLVDVNGTLYGTTRYGGAGVSIKDCGCGTVYAITTKGNERVIYSFQSVIVGDGLGPSGTLIDMNGILYGTTLYGGDYGQGGCGNSILEAGCGTVFSVTATGTETVLHRFTADTDGAMPKGALLALNGTLYGTTQYARRFVRRGQPGGPGTVFALSP